MNVLFFSLTVIAIYFIGAIPFGYLIGKIFKKIDIRNHGSHNIGATNVFRVAGKKYGIICFILDILKGFIPVILISQFYHVQFESFLSVIGLKIILGAAAVCGHIWPLYLKFKGGKGVATTFGVFLAIDPVSVLISFGIWLIFTVIFRIISLSSIIAAVSLPFIQAFNGKSWYVVLFTAVMVTIIVFRHKKNIGRLMQGIENKI